MCMCVCARIVASVAVSAKAPKARRTIIQICVTVMPKSVASEKPSRRHTTKTKASASSLPSSSAAAKRRGGILGMAARSMAGSSAAGDNTPAKKKSKMARGEECRCMMCLQTPAVCKWAEVSEDKSGSIIPVGELCHDCKLCWDPFRKQYPDLKEFLLWCRTPEGAAAIDSALTKSGKSATASALPTQQVSSRVSYGSRIFRDFWVCNASEFKTIMAKDPNARMPKVPMMCVPSESGGGMEKVYCFAVDSLVWPLRKMQMWVDLNTEHMTEDMPTATSKFKAHARTTMDRVVAQRQADLQHDVLFTSAQLLTISAFQERFGCKVAPQRSEAPATKVSAGRYAASSAAGEVSRDEALGAGHAGDGEAFATPVKRSMDGGEGEGDGEPAASEIPGSSCRESADGDSGSENTETEEDDGDKQEVGKLVGTSPEILAQLKQRMNLRRTLRGYKLGRSSNGSKAYLTNGSLNKTDVILLKKHFAMVLGGGHFRAHGISGGCAEVDHDMTGPDALE